MLRIIAKKYPNNEIRVRMQPARGGKPFSYDELEEEAAPQDSVPLLLDIRRDFETKHQDAPSGFGSMPRKTRFGLNAKNTLLRLGGVFDKLGVPPENFVFLTGTLPGSTTSAMAAIAQWSGWIVHRLKAWLNKYQQGERLDFYVWERQKRGALHLHYCVYCPDSGKRQRILERFKSQWIRLLDTVGESSNTDMYARDGGGTWANAKEVTQAYAQEVFKSVVAYLAKYCSKEAGKDESGEYYPSRWWGCSRSCTRYLREMSEEVELDCLLGNRASSLFEECKRTLATFTNKCHAYKDKVGQGFNVVAYTPPKDLNSIWTEIKNMLQPKAFLLDSSLRRELTQWIEIVLTSRYLAHRFFSMQTGLVTLLASSWQNSMPLSLTELGMLADSCWFTCKSELTSRRLPTYLRQKINSLLGMGVRWNEFMPVPSVSAGENRDLGEGVLASHESDDCAPGMRPVQLHLAID